MKVSHTVSRASGALQQVGRHSRSLHAAAAAADASRRASSVCPDTSGAPSRVKRREAISSEFRRLNFLQVYRRRDRDGDFKESPRATLHIISTTSASGNKHKKNRTKQTKKHYLSGCVCHRLGVLLGGSLPNPTRRRRKGRKGRKAAVARRRAG